MRDESRSSAFERIADGLTVPIHRMRGWLKLRRALGLCAVHGLQRSGTNYLEACLDQLRVAPVNLILPRERNHPQHKHFRWYPDKSAIPPFLRPQFGNDLIVGDVAQLNAAAGYRADCPHLVMQKPRIDWLASACNWGLRVRWFRDDEEALRNLAVLQRDYDAYYGFWHALADAAPDRVVIHDLATMRADFAGFLQSLDRLGIGYRIPRGFDGHIEQVRLSQTDRKVWIRADDIRARLCAGDAEKG